MIDLSNYINEYGVHNGSYFQRNMYQRCDQQKEAIQTLRDGYDNTDIYKCMYAYENDDYDNARIYAPMYLDFDIDAIEDKANFRKVKADLNMTIMALNEDWGIPVEMLKIYFSGNKGFHIIIDPVIFGAESKQDLNLDYKIFAAEICNQTSYHTIDIRMYDRRRLFRIENSINAKRNLYKIQLKPDEIEAMTYESLTKLASSQRELKSTAAVEIPSAVSAYRRKLKQASQYKIKKVVDRKAKAAVKEKYSGPKEILPCILSGIEDGAPIGSRNNVMVALASGLFQFGQDTDQVFELMLQWNESNEEPLTEKEIQTTIRSAELMYNSGRKYGCEAFKSLGLCTGADCKLFNRER